MASETDFLNGALGLIGATRITGIDDGSVNANWIKVFYEPLRRAVLRSHHWNFAEARQELAQDAVAPTFEFSYSYTLPPNLLKIKEYNGDEPKIDPAAVDPAYWVTTAGNFKVEGDKILTNDSVVKIVFVRDMTNPALWDALFYQALEMWLAAKLAFAINKDTAKASSLLSSTLELLLPLAAAVDGQEGTVHPYRTDDLLWGR